MAHVFFTGHLVMLNIGYLVHWTTIVDHSREFLAFQRESIKNAGHKYEEEFEQIWNRKISEEWVWRKAKDFKQIWKSKISKWVCRKAGWLVGGLSSLGRGPWPPGDHQTRVYSYSYISAQWPYLYKYASQCTYNSAQATYMGDHQVTLLHSRYFPAFWYSVHLSIQNTILH